jgi:SAM-dependent methyltransferase
MTLYEHVLDQLLRADVIGTGDKVLVICGNAWDRGHFLDRGFSDVTISNIDNSIGDKMAPSDWARIDAEDIALPDNSVDVAIVHAGLHHCRSPHRGLCEMLRIARKAVIVIEARDSFVMRLAERIGMTPRYELEAVALEGNSGGVRNTAVPNFIYRWTEREVRKTIESARPEIINEFRFWYGLRLPTQRLSMSSSSKQILARIFGACAKLVAWLLPRQGNEFAFAVMPAADKPWIARENGHARLSRTYRLGFDPAKYRRAV